MQGASRKPLKMSTEYLGVTAPFATRTGIRPPCKSNPSPTTTWGNKLEGKFTLVVAIATLQQASGASAIRIAEMKQAESTVDQLRDCPLEGIPTHRDHTVIVLVLTRNTQAQIEMGLPPIAPLGNPLIIEQSRETGTFGKVLVARYQVESIINTRTSIMANDTCTTANSQQDIMIKSAETS